MTATTINRRDIFDALCSAVDTVRELNAHRPERLARVNSAWGWLLEQETYTLEGDDLLIPSVSEPGVIRRANWRGCNCPSRYGCYHVEAASLIGRALRLANRPAGPLPFEPSFACSRYSRANDPRVSVEDLVNDLF